jgi:ComF family protein
VAALDYAYPWAELIGRFKFSAALHLAPTLARCLQQAVQEADVEPARWLLPVPLHGQRLRERGYNQAWELARRLRTPARRQANLLQRWKPTAHQVDLPAEQRAANVADAFVVRSSARPQLRDSVVAVVDDVMTSGATLQACALALKQAGAREVQAWVLARTPAPGA